MQRVLVLYYSRTGTTRTLAKALADEFRADLAEIRCPRYDGGPLRTLRAGYDSLVGNLPPIKVLQATPRDYDLLLLGAPIWTSHPAVPLRAFLASAPALPDRVGLFLAHGGHSPPETAVSETEALLPGRLEASLTLRDSEVRGEGLNDAVVRFAEQLTLSQARPTSRSPSSVLSEKSVPA